MISVPTILISSSTISLEQPFNAQWNGVRPSYKIITESHMITQKMHLTLN